MAPNPHKCCRILANLPSGLARARPLTRAPSTVAYVNFYHERGVKPVDIFIMLLSEMQERIRTCTLQYAGKPSAKAEFSPQRRSKAARAMKGRRGAESLQTSLQGLRARRLILVYFEEASINIQDD